MLRNGVTQGMTGFVAWLEIIFFNEKRRKLAGVQRKVNPINYYENHDAGSNGSSFIGVQWGKLRWYQV